MLRYFWPEQEWRQIVTANPHTGSFNLSLRDLGDTFRELDDLRAQVGYLERLNRALLESLELERGGRRDEGCD